MKIKNKSFCKVINVKCTFNWKSSFYSFLIFSCLLTSCTPVIISDREQWDKKPFVGSASFAPKGDLIALTFYSANLSGIFLANMQGRVISWLYKDSKNWYCIQPTFSPDGKEIAFVSNQAEKNGDIYVMSVNGKNVRRLTSTKDEDVNPIFSHDGKKIFFLRRRNPRCRPFSDLPCSGDSDIYFVNLVNGKDYAVTNEKFATLYSFSLYPQDDYLLLATTQYIKLRHLLWKIDVNNPKLKYPVLPNLSRYTAKAKEKNRYFNTSFVNIRQALLSRSGEYMVFPWLNETSPSDRWTQLYVTNMNNMETLRVTNMYQTAYLSDISFNGEKILFITGGGMDDSNGMVFQRSNLWIVNRDGTGLRNFSLDFSDVLASEPTRNTPPTSSTK